MTSCRTSDAPEVVGRKPRVGSLFAGVEGFGQGLEQAGFEVAWQVEIDKDAVSVLERHYPTVRRYRDVREVNGAELPTVDVLVGGFPCQDLSVAGRRQGLAGERSGLFYEVARIAAETATPWLLLENVPGLLSSFTPIESPPSDVPPGTEWTVEETADLGVVLSTLAEHGYGFCTRILDAQHVGVPQRRERVFIVGCLGDTGARAAEVLLEPESVLWDLAACLQKGQGTPVVPENSAGSGGVPDVAYTLRHNTNGSGSSDNAWNTTYVPAAVAAPLTAAMNEGHNGQDDRTPGFLIPVGVVGALPSGVSPLGHGTAGVNNQAVNAGHIIPVAAPLTAGGHPNSNMPGRHREDDQNLVAAFDERNVTSAANRSRCEPGLPSGTLHADGMAVAFTNRGEAVEGAHENLHAGSHGALPMVAQASVRRLMPVECERLMGWPDGHTERRADGSLIPDGPRYRMIGNGVVAPVARWTGERLIRVMRSDL